MAKATRRTREAGRLVEQIQYTRVSRSDGPEVRREKKRQTTEAMRRYNKKTSIRKFELLLAANFRRGDIVGCVTYDDAHLPQTRKEAETRFRYFRQKIKKACAAKGVEVVIFWSTESKHGDGRWHHHFVMTATGDDYKLIRASWIYGDIAEFTRLQVARKRNFATLASYFAKEAREKLGLRSWSYTRNARKPREDVETVDSREHLDPPKNVTVIESYTVENEFGRWQYLKYLLPEATGSSVRARRRR